jgi:hypothetical protein
VIRGPEAERLRLRIAFFVTAIMLLGIAVILPFSVQSVVDDVLGPATGHVVRITPPVASGVGDYCRLHLAAIGMDETQLLATLRLAGHCACRDACDGSYRIVLASVADDDAEAEGMPPSVTVSMKPAAEPVSETIHLPLRGHPVRYPFDHYEMVLGVAFQRLDANGVVRTLSEQETTGHLGMSIQELLPRHTMSLPVAVTPASIRSDDDAIPYAYAFGVSFDRPRYLRLLTVILVVLIAAAAAYAVFMRPLEDLVVNSGALVLGVWGIRGILTPGNMYYLTAVDLALSIVIIFLLGAITVRALMYIHDRGDMRVLRRRPPSSRD